MIDHIIYAHPDLDAAVAAFERRYGVTPSPGGRHVGFGTRNALVGLGQHYLELMAIDPEQEVTASQRFFSLNAGFAPRYASWCARTNRPLEETLALARDAGLDLGEIVQMSRVKPDGSRMSWRLTSPFAHREGGVIPFFIDWGNSTNPAMALPPLLSLASLTVIHPEAARIRAILDALGERDVRVDSGPKPELEVSLVARAPDGG